MNKCCIGFGFSSLFLYVFYCFLSRIFGDFILSFSIIKKDFKYSIFYFEPELKDHREIQNLYNYIGFIIFGIFFYYYFEIRKNKKKRNESENSSLTTKLIFHENDISKIKPRYKALLICFIYVFSEEIIDIKYALNLDDLDLWIFNILFTLIFMSFYYNIKEYTHQLYSMIFIFVIDFFLLIIYSFLPKYDNKRKEKLNVYENVNNIFKNDLYSIPIIFILIIISCLMSYARVEAKVLMEKEYMPPYKLLTLIGIYGLFLTIISLFFTSLFNCGENIQQKCEVYNKPKNESDITFYDSFAIYIYNLKDRSTLEFLIEFLINTPLFAFANYLRLFFEIIIIYFLNPIYILVYESLYYAVLTLLSFILNKGNDKMDDSVFILYFTVDIVAIIGYLIYLEIIELRFCGLNNYTRKTIYRRGRRESLATLVGLSDIGKEIDESFDDNSEIINGNELESF